MRKWIWLQSCCNPKPLQVSDFSSCWLLTFSIDRLLCLAARPFASTSKGAWWTGGREVWRVGKCRDAEALR